MATATACALLGLDATSTSAPTTWLARPSTSCACGCLARPCAVCPRAAGAEGARSTKRSRLGDRRDRQLLPARLCSGRTQYPLMVREFQSVIGREARAQFAGDEGLPTPWSPAWGAVADALGIFDAFIKDQSVRLIGVEAGGEGLSAGRHHRGSRPGLPACFRGRARSFCRTRTATSS